MSFLKKILTTILIFESRLILRKYRPFIVAVTGSVGKTSTKDAIYTVLNSKKVCDQQHLCFVRKSEKSLNSEIGLPLTIIGVPNAWHDVRRWFGNIVTGLKLIIFKSAYPDCLILEIGADHPGDIRSVAKWLNPDIVVVTKVGSTPVHVEFFKSPEQVFEEKASLAEGVKIGGTVILFADDPKVLSIAERIKNRQAKIITFGTDTKSDVRGSEATITYGGALIGGSEAQNMLNDTPGVPESAAPSGTSFTLHIGDLNATIAIPRALGKTYLYPLLAAAAVGKAREIDFDFIVEGLSSYEPPRGRMNVLSGANGSILIDDTYNSSPDAAEAALQTLGEITCTGKKIAFLGDMMELGKYSSEEHRRIGKLAASVVSKLVTVGPRSKMTAEEAVKNGLSSEAVIILDTSDTAAAKALSLVGSGDIVLIKGSQSVRMERVTRALMSDPDSAATLLVRQEKEWMEKK